MFYFRLLLFLFVFVIANSTRLPLEVYNYRPDEHHLHHHKIGYNFNTGHRKKIQNLLNLRILYQIGKSEDDLPICNAKQVCNKIDHYDTPWLERQCRCPNDKVCPSSLKPDDGYSLVDKVRQYKLCEPIKKIPKCRYFRDITWTLKLSENNATEQIVHCRCPRNSVVYLIKRQIIHGTKDKIKYLFAFACSPPSRIHCQRKEPCRLFSVRKRQEFLDEVNFTTLCQCPHGHRCPRYHTDYGTIAEDTFVKDLFHTYSGYCIPNGGSYT